MKCTLDETLHHDDINNREFSSTRCIAQRKLYWISLFLDTHMLIRYPPLIPIHLLAHCQKPIALLSSD